MTTMTRFYEEVVCPKCRKSIDAATGQDGTTPKTGDFSVCFGCGLLMRFTQPPKVREASKADLKALGTVQLTELFRMRSSIWERNKENHEMG